MHKKLCIAMLIFVANALQIIRKQSIFSPVASSEESGQAFLPKHSKPAEPKNALPLLLAEREPDGEPNGQSKIFPAAKTSRHLWNDL
jgi:hypothetical protein